MYQLPTKFVISPIGGKQYNDTKEVNGKELIVSTSIENHLDVQRIGVVKALPFGYKGDVILGDLVVVHHNTFRIMLDHKGVPEQSENYISKDLFAVTRDAMYMIIRGEEIIPTDDNVFVLPIVTQTVWHGEKEEDNIGIAQYVNSILKSQGVENGSKIAFKNYSKYQFEILGRKFYLMKNRRVVAKLS